MRQFTIPRVTVLHGHVSPETAYLVNDYPYGRTLRCQMRYWLQTAAKGQYRGQTRLMRQSTNPKRGDALNPPKAWGQYAHFMVMYLDPTQQNRQGEDYVRTMACGPWLNPVFHARMTLTGALHQLTEAELARYTTLLNISQGEANKRSWAEWDTLLGLVRATSPNTASRRSAPTTASCSTGTSWKTSTCWQSPPCWLKPKPVELTMTGERRRPPQWFYFGPWAFSIDEAETLIADQPREPASLNVAAWANAYGLTHIDNPNPPS